MKECKELLSVKNAHDVDVNHEKEQNEEEGISSLVHSLSCYLGQFYNLLMISEFEEMMREQRKHKKAQKEMEKAAEKFNEKLLEDDNNQPSVLKV